MRANGITCNGSSKRYSTHEKVWETVNEVYSLPSPLSAASIQSN